MNMNTEESMKRMEEEMRKTRMWKVLMVCEEK